MNEIAYEGDKLDVETVDQEYQQLQQESQQLTQAIQEFASK